MCQFVPNFISCVSAKFYLNCFTVEKVISKIKRVNLFLRHSVYICFAAFAILMVYC